MKHYAVFGSPIRHSLSPYIYNTLFDNYGVDAEFGMVLMDEGGLWRLRGSARGLSGFALTMPLKSAAIRYLDELTDTAIECGAVNIVLSREGRLIGYNTDGEGAADALTESLKGISGSRIFIIGRGGAARSAASALKKRGCSVTYLVRDIRNGEELLINDAAQNCGAKNCDILINASPLGMGGEDFPYLELLDSLSPKAVLDMVYKKNGRTALINKALSQGVIALSGQRMLLHQALRAFEIWTGIKADPALFDSKL